MRGSCDSSIEESPGSGKRPGRTLEAHAPEELYIARILVRNRREVPVRVLNATRRGQKLAHCQPVTLVAPADAEHPKVPDPTPKLQDVIAAARRNLSDAESRKLEELLTEYGDIFAMKSDYYGRADQVYHRIDTGQARPTRQPPEEAPPSKTGGCVLHARGHAMTCGYQRVRQPLVIPAVLVRKNGGLHSCVNYR
jgi:hypothetical protein